MPPLWPSAFPLWPHVDAVSGALQPNHIGFEADLGLPIERRQTTTEIEIWSVTFPPVDKAAMEAWRAFYKTDLKSGVLPFVWVHPLREVVREGRIIKGQGSPAWAYVPGGTWRLSLSIAFRDLLPSYAADVVVGDTALSLA